MTLCLAYDNLADGSIISTVSAPIPTLPTANLKDPDVQKIWRSGSLNGDSLIIDLGAAYSIGVVGLVNCNLVVNSSVQVRISTNDNTGVNGNAYNSGVVSAGVDPTFALFLHFIQSTPSGRYVRIDISTLANAQAGRLIIANTWTPSRDMSFGWERAGRDLSRHTMSLGHNDIIDRTLRQKAWRFRLFGVTEAEADNQLEFINRVNGTSQDVLVCRNVDSDNLGKYSIWGNLIDLLQISQIKDTDLFEAEFTIYERL